MRRHEERAIGVRDKDACVTVRKVVDNRVATDRSKAPVQYEELKPMKDGWEMLTAVLSLRRANASIVPCSVDHPMLRLSHPPRARLCCLEVGLRLDWTVEEYVQYFRCHGLSLLQVWVV